MDYASSSDEDENNDEPDKPKVTVPDRRYLQAAPMAGALIAATAAPPTTLVVGQNSTKSVMYQPMQGPQAMDPLALVAQQQKQSKGGRNITTTAHYDATNFTEQRIQFQSQGQAMSPDGDRVVLRTTLGYTDDRLQQIAATEERQRKRPRNDKNDQQLVEGSDDEADYGVWGPPTTEERWAAQHYVTDMQKGDMTEAQEKERALFLEKRRRYKGLEEEQDSQPSQAVEQKMAHLVPGSGTCTEDAAEEGGGAPKKGGPIEASTEFHGKEAFDYKGNSWMAPPAGTGSIRADGGKSNHRCYVPKQVARRFVSSSERGVQRVRLFPVTGHLVLSANLDGNCQVWSLETNELMRTYKGHSAAVRDVQFNRDGSKFLSASFDRYIRLWSTETGQVLKTFSNRKLPYVIQFYPRNNKFFVAGCNDSKIVAYNTETGNVTQEYNHHLGPVNAITFVNDYGTTKMVTSSDDKKILVWEWDIGVPIKYISDPSMHSMPCLVHHPTEHWFVGQSLDNSIVVFQAGGKFTLSKKKKFAGHVVSGYACEPTFSPDGQFLVSGDGTGALIVWDWKKQKILRKFRAHDNGPAISCAWHPLEPSVLVSCGWDGVIKVWK